MLKKITIFLTIIILTKSCGFEPIYSNKNNNNNNFSIEKIEFDGDRTLNNYLKINLIKFKNQESSKKYFINIETEYKKNNLTKDSTGKTTNYELTAKATIIIRSENKKLIFSEKKIMEIMDDKFQENRYEMTVKQKFASSISNKLVSALMTLQ